MKRIFSIIILTILTTVIAKAQMNERLGGDGFTIVDDGPDGAGSRKKKGEEQNKEIPKGMYVWKIDQRFGDREMVDRDTLQHLFMNSTLTTGRYGQFNTTGNLGAPRINRIFADRKNISEFLFANPFDFFLTPIDELRFTNTLSPITNLSYYSCGDKLDGEDYLKAKFAINAGKRIGVGMMFNYMYGRGLYQNQSTALFDWTFWASYLGERYQAHFAFSTDHMKVTESGGITNDEYITHPESFKDNFTANEIPTVLSNNWNQIDGLHGFLSHRYNVGFFKKVPMTEDEIKARRFAIESQKDKEEKERVEKLGAEEAAKPVARFSGRPSDAKIMGDLVADTLLAAQNNRIEVNDSLLADSSFVASNVEKNDTSWTKEVYVPVTSFIHTLQIDKFKRIYRAKNSPTGYYEREFGNVDATINGMDIYDLTNHYSIRNTFALAMLEGFNKWAKAGVKVFGAHELSHYELPDSIGTTNSYNESTFFVGGQLQKTLGRIFHYNATAELGAVGKNAGNLKVDFTGDVNIPLFGDTTSVILNGFMHRERPTFLLRHYHSKHYWWDRDDFESQMHTHIEGRIELNKTNTSLRVAYDNVENYTYLGMGYDIDSNSKLPVNHRIAARQTSRNISLLTAEVGQDVRLGILNWENKVTFQKSSEQLILPVPTLNVWTNLYLNFKIARVLSCHFGAEATWFTEYEAPEYAPGLAFYAVQENDAVRKKIGNYPFVNVYANFVLKGCRFFVMMSHVNAGQGTLNYFTTPHYPMNDRVLRMGLSWNFYN